MLKNYIKIAFRKLRKHKIDSVISIGGLAVGIACCLLLMLSVRFEFTYDDFHKNGNRIYRVTESSVDPSEEVLHNLIQPFPLATALDSTYPEIEHTVRLTRGGLQVKQDDKFYLELALLAGPIFSTSSAFP